jgi:hypothetical protein
MTRYEIDNFRKKIEITLYVDDNNTITKIYNPSKYRMPFTLNSILDVNFLEIWCISREFDLNIFDN